MNKNKGFIGIGLIIAIVLGAIIIGGGAYYLGRSGSKPVVINPENILPNNQNQNLPVVDNSQQVNVANTTHSSSITVLSPNGGEVYKDTDKIAIKWKDTGKDRIAIYLRFSSGEWCLIKDVPSTDTNYTFTPYGHDCGDGRGSISGTQKYKITLIVYKNEGMAPEPGTAFAGDYSDNNGSDTGYSIDSSDNYFTINSTKVSPSTSMKLLSFTANKGEFLAETPRLNSSNVEIKVYYIPTGTGVTEPSLLGSLAPFTGSSGSIQTWSLSAYIQPYTKNQTPLLATSIFATLYIDGKVVNTINYPVTGASAIYDSIYGNIQ